MKRIALLLLLAMAALGTYVWTRPSDFRIERSEMIGAPPDAVFRNLDDPRRWGAWLPWEGADSDAEQGYDGPRSGVGASHRWGDGAGRGAGRMTVTASDPPTRLAVRLELPAPMYAANEAVFQVSPHIAGTTEVRWVMTGRHGFAAKARALLVDVDADVGAAMEQGLAELRRVAEEDAAAEEARRAAEASAAITAAAGPPAEDESPAQTPAVPTP